MTFLERLKTDVDHEWARIKTGRFWRHFRSTGTVDRQVYVSAMTQVYHYTRHNSLNQACAVFGGEVADPKLLRFVYKHALEELGHENMVVHDLRRAGLLSEDRIEAAPLPETQALIGYLYYVAVKKGPIARLGYSFWAESCYDHLGEFIVAAKKSLGLTDTEMTFLVSHSEIDAKHSQEVEQAIAQFVVSPEEERAVHEVALTTLRLTGALLDSACERELGPERPTS
jgi:hypothetical protein